MRLSCTELLSSSGVGQIILESSFQGVAETFLIDKEEVVCPFCPRPCEDLVNNPLGNVALENIGWPFSKERTILYCMRRNQSGDQILSGRMLGERRGER